MAYLIPARSTKTALGKRGARDAPLLQGGCLRWAGRHGGLWAPQGSSRWERPGKVTVAAFLRQVQAVGPVSGMPASETVLWGSL